MLQRTFAKSSPVRLMFVATLPQTHLGFLRGQNSHMQSAGFELHAVACPGPQLEALRERDSVTVHALPMSRRIQPLRDLLAVWRMWRIFRRVRPHIVHLSTPKAALVGAVAGFLAGVPIRIYLVRGSVTDHAIGWKHWVHRHAEKLTASLCHEVVVVSRSLLEFLHAEGIVAKHRGRVIGAGMSNGIDATRFDPAVYGSTEIGAPSDCRELVIGFVGRLNRDKGIEELTQAWRLLRERFPQLKLLIVGNWEEEVPIAPEIRKALESDPRVEFAGFVNDVRPLYARMSVMAFPSHREGFPNAPMEAAAMGIPVVGARAVGVVDAIVDGETGGLVEVGNAAELAARLQEYLQDPELRRVHGDAARTRILREFYPRRIWEGMLELYCEWLSRRGLNLPASRSAVTEPTIVRRAA